MKEVFNIKVKKRMERHIDDDKEGVGKRSTHVKKSYRRLCSSIDR